MTRGRRRFVLLHLDSVILCIYVYKWTVHAVRACAARACACVCVGFRRVCMSLGWSCGVLLMRVSEVKSVLGSTLRLLRGLLCEVMIPVTESHPTYLHP